MMNINPHLWWLLPAAVAALFLGLLYVYAPLKVRATQVRLRDPGYRPIDAAALPDEAAAAFGPDEQYLARQQFHLVARLAHDALGGAQTAYVAIWSNPSAGDTAQLIAVRTFSPQLGHRWATLATYRTYFRDQTELVTSNTSTPGVFPQNPKVDPISCPGVQDLDLLYRFHRARLARDAGRRTATLDPVRDGVACATDEHHRTYEWLTGAGYYDYDPSARVYRPTVRGAFIMTYRLLWPLKQLRLAARRRKADRALRELGFGGLQQFQRESASNTASAAAATAATAA